MCTLLKYDYYFDIILVYKKILDTRGKCIERDARAPCSLSMCHVSERDILKIVSQLYQTRLDLRLFCLPLVHQCDTKIIGRVACFRDSWLVESYVPV
jgi:hypothetical protein